MNTVASLHRFPVKSMQGDSPGSVEVTENGVVGDRTWALRDAETGKLVSAKRPRLWRALLDCTASGTGDDVTVTLPDGETYGIEDAGLRISLSALLGREIAVEESTHAMQGNYESDWPEIEGITLAGEMEFPTNLTGEGTSFIDLGILHVLTTTSMATLAAAAPDVTIDVRRFRPSILLDTPDLTGFPENDWTGRTLTIGTGDDAVEITMGDPAPRCIMTTVAQGDLPREPGVLKAIAAENKLTNELGSFACLGAYATVTRGGTIETGAPMTLAD